MFASYGSRKRVMYLDRDHEVGWWSNGLDSVLVRSVEFNLLFGTESS